MLKKLSIRNYAIIRELIVEFDAGFSVITGETGAGKSIIMGAMGLILGQRADSTALNNNQSKCIIEGRFSVDGIHDLERFFDKNDLDFEDPVLLRREINSSGKSRAFINDTPVQLTLLKELGVQLIDIHSQHSNLELGKKQFQLNVLDWYGGHTSLVSEYKNNYQTLLNTQRQLVELTDKANQAKTDFDYFQFQFQQLEEATLIENEQERLEQEQELLNHSEEIKSNLSEAYNVLDGGEMAVLPMLKDAVTSVEKLNKYLPKAAELYQRLQSTYIELQDLANETELLGETTEHDPDRLNFISERLDTIYSLQQKHRVDSVTKLIEIRDEFDSKIQQATSFDNEIENLLKQVETLEKEVMLIANQLSEKRKGISVQVEKEICSYLQQLGMPNSLLEIKIDQQTQLSTYGIDEVSFLFNANKGGKPEEINKIASGGEMSRLMLAIKTVVSKSKALPAIIFDEIDTGISGEVAMKMASILKQMATNMQVISISHLPQIAAMGNSHFLVYKKETETSTETGMCRLNNNERIEEIAKMLSGENPTNEAIENARALISTN